MITCDADGSCVIDGRPYICTRGVTVRYGRRPAVADVDFRAGASAITAIVGPSGCGKSSFLAALNRLTDHVDDCDVRGEVRIGEVDVYHPATDTLALRRRVGMIFQRPNPFPVSVRDNIALTLRQHGHRDRTDVARRVEESLRGVGLWDEVKDRLAQAATQLSGGQQQRLCIARAIALEPEVILFDEPCSALDPIASGVVEDLIGTLKDRYTVVIVTHNLAQARRLADATAVFWTSGGVGRLVEQGPTARLFEAAADPVTAAYLTGRHG